MLLNGVEDSSLPAQIMPDPFEQICEPTPPVSVRFAPDSWHLWPWEMPLGTRDTFSGE